MSVRFERSKPATVHRNFPPIEDAHQKAAHHGSPCRKASASASEVLFKHLRQCHRPVLAQWLDAKARLSDQSHGHRLADAGHRATETLRVARLRRVHAGDDAKLRCRERGNVEMKVHFPSCDQVILPFSHIATHGEARSHRHQQMKPHDAAIEQPAKMGARRLRKRREHKNHTMMPGSLIRPKVTVGGKTAATCLGADFGAFWGTTGYQNPSEILCEV